MLTSDFNYNLPPHLIAQTPSEPRDTSRLMIVNRATRQIEHKIFRDLVDYLGPNDLVVWNSSKVFKARLRGRIFLDEGADDISDSAEAKIQPTDKILNVTKSVEIFLVRPLPNNGVWRVLAKPAKKLRLGYKIVFAPDFSCTVIEKEIDGSVIVQFSDSPAIVRQKANKYGSVPTPPYIANVQLSMNNDQFSNQYQTVYAKEEGSVAAPTAGFHFTPELIAKLKQNGVQFAEVTLHVGLGTFLPVKTETIEEHNMHSEWVEITPENSALINSAKAEGRRIVAVGTTTARTLEAVARLGEMGNKVRPYSGDINIFITPGFDFKIVDALITNFHLPESTLLMLVSAFAPSTSLSRQGAKATLGATVVASGAEFVLQCYQEAIDKHYRFYSFGDAMFII